MRIALTGSATSQLLSVLAREVSERYGVDHFDALMEYSLYGYDISDICIDEPVDYASSEDVSASATYRVRSSVDQSGQAGPAPHVFGTCKGRVFPFSP